MHQESTSVRRGSGSGNTVVQDTPRRRNLFDAFPMLRRFVGLRSFQFLMVLPSFILFYLFVIAGVIGSPVGNRNIIIVCVWIAWWFLLVTLMVPFFARVWCVMCPFPFFGDWFQRGTLISVRNGKTGSLRNKMFGLNKRWPRRVANIWLQNIGFLLLATFFVILATRPFVSAIVLGGLFILATVLAMVYQRRAFCTYVCPVSGFLGLYSMASPIELRAIDRQVCVRCRSKSCSVGSDNGWACPWFLYVGKLDRNNFCGLCMECVKSCPSDNVGLLARPFFADTEMKGYDEAWKAFIMLSLAVVYAVVLQGPWGFLRDWANVTATGNWGDFLLFALIVWSVSLLVLPGLWWIAIVTGKLLSRASSVRTKRLFVRYSFVLIPLGLAAWIAFTVPLVLANGSYVVSVVSDPLGRGWDLFNTARVPWTPIYPEYGVYLQSIVILIGLAIALGKGYEIGRLIFGDDRQAIRSFAPVAGFCALTAVALLVLFGG